LSSRIPAKLIFFLASYGFRSKVLVLVPGSEIGKKFIPNPNPGVKKKNTESATLNSVRQNLLFRYLADEKSGQIVYTNSFYSSCRLGDKKKH
jgi:hypothetical protein